MQKWEYLHLLEGDPASTTAIKVGTESKRVEIIEYLNMLGDDGWELVHMVPSEGRSYHYIFKRPRKV